MRDASGSGRDRAPVPSKRKKGMRQPVDNIGKNWLTKLRKALGQLFPPKLLGRIATIPNDSTVMASKGRIRNTTGADRAGSKA